MSYTPGQIIIPRGGIGGNGIIGITQFDGQHGWFVVNSLERTQPLAGPIANRADAMAEARRQMAAARAAYE